MNRADLHALYAYSDNCWRLLNDVLAAAPDAYHATFETISQWKSVHLLMAHCIGAEERIVSARLMGLDVAVPYEKRLAGNWEELYRDHRLVRQATYDYIDSLPDAAFASKETVIASLGGGPALTRADALFHVFNHENFCRGAVITALQRLGLDPPNFDYVLLKDQQQSL